VTDPGRPAETHPLRTVEVALSADLAGAVGDADVFVRALNELTKMAPQDLADDIAAIAALAVGDLGLAQERWAAVRARLDDDLGMRGRQRAPAGRAR
jgi:hypothetical protein